MERIEHLTPLAQQGNISAQLQLGKSYLNGTDGVQDPEQALYWLQKAAMQDNPEALCLLGDCYRQGTGTLADRELAERLYLAAARMDDPRGQYQLGLMLLQDQDWEAEAHGWLRLAARTLPEARALLAEEAENLRDSTYYDTLPLFVRPNAERNDPDAQYSMSYYCKDHYGRLYWLRRAAENGHPKACRALAKRYTEGDGLYRNRKAAAYWEEKAKEWEGKQ